MGASQAATTLSSGLLHRCILKGSSTGPQKAANHLQKSGSELAVRRASLQIREGGVVADGRRAKEYVPVS